MKNRIQQSEYHSKNIERIIEETDIFDNSEASIRESFKMLINQSKWFGDAHEFLWMLDGDSSIKPRNPVVLGLSHVNETTESFGYAVQGMYWLGASILLGVPIDHQDHTNVFMQKLVDSNKDIVFIVPPQLFTHSKSKNTRNEMYWLLNHPECAKNVFFVFGAYDLLDSNWFRKNTAKFRHHENEAQEKSRVLRTWRKRISQ